MNSGDIVELLQEKDYSIVYEMMVNYLFYTPNDARYILYDDYFKFIQKNEEKIIGFIFNNELNYYINTYTIQCSQLRSLAVHVDYRNRNYSRKMMETYQKYVNKRSLLSSVFTYTPKYFAKFGYIKIYDIHRITLLKSEFIHYNIKGISTDYNANELYNAYHQFSNAFEHYLKRDILYFEKLINHIEHSNKKIITYYGKSSKCEGYAVYNLNKNGECKIDELIYTTSSALKNLCAYISQGYFDIVVEVTQFEAIQKLFKHSIMSKEKCCMIKINQLSLFNKLFMKKAKSTAEIASFFNKKSYFQDYFN